MKRFYREASVVSEAGAYSVVLDGRPVLSPGRTALTLPTERVAASIAAEWNAQGEEIAPESMSMTRFANSAIDRVRPRKDEVVKEIAGYAETDLLCYRTATPPALAERQSYSWQPILDWAADRYGARFRVTEGIVPVEQDADAVAALRAQVAAMNEFGLSALHSLTSASGSILLALAVAERRLSPEEAAAASLIDETYQAEEWGEDAEAVARWEAIGVEISSAAQFLELVANS